MCGIDQTIHPIASDTMQTAEDISSLTEASRRLPVDGKHGSQPVAAKGSGLTPTLLSAGMPHGCDNTSKEQTYADEQ
ncbi:hypothetical protein DBR13_10430 [Aeromonas sp. HMWF015]|nr:hypothetical protein DBR13_10430 [Aeromonas sp. HMWF015]